MFARRRTGGPSPKAVAIVVAAAFVGGIAVGWGTGLVGESLAAPEPTVSPTPSPDPSATPEISLPDLAPIDRELDEADRLAGLTRLEVPTTGAGTFTTVSSDGEATADAAAVKTVRIEFEDGLQLDGQALAEFVLAVLNDPRGWGARGRYEFVPTTGASDVRVVIASPVTTASTCLTPHAAASSVGTADDAASAEPTVTASPAEAVTCADRGLVMISGYDWAAGLDAYGTDTTGARAYLVNHGVGHLLGTADEVCESGRAPIMADQRELPEVCEPNPWPSPDEPLPEPSTTASAEN